MGEIKPSFDTNRQVLGKILPLDTPFNVILDVSEVCNFKCNYCFRSDKDKGHWGYAKDNKLMSWDMFARAVEQIKEFPQEVKQISLSCHGEPLLNRNVPDMVRYIKKQGIQSRVSIHTNASLLDEKYVYDLADSNIDRVVVSLQGLTESKYQTICGAKIDYQKFYNNLKLFYHIKKDTQIHIKIANVALDEGEEEKFYSLYGQIADRVFVEQIVPIWKDVKLENSTTSVQNKYGNSFPLQNCCPLIFHTIVVIPNGDVYPCTQLLSQHNLGNIRSKTLVEIWNSDERTNLLMNQVELSREELCEDCYILQNSIYSREDMIDDYRLEIRDRLYQKVNLDSASNVWKVVKRKYSG